MDLQPPDLPPRAPLVVPGDPSTTKKSFIPPATLRAVLAFNPVKTAYHSILPYIVNAQNNLGEDSPAARARALARIQDLTKWLDAKYKIPFTKYKLGLDPLISAVPYIGDVVSTGMSCYIVYLARRFHVPWHVSARMVFNVFLNASFGAIPIVGSAFDMTYKPNMRNLILLEEFLRKEAVSAGQDPSAIDAALRKSRAEVISFTESDDIPPLVPDAAAVPTGSSTGVNATRAGTKIR
ncbi:hypothetical protein DFS34DRAFT_132796 [Phlyctochytrium arcticum]|nr:hypothetical protein DFS34DRAFT_132796 [Phlyctochytrium arcticum]